MSDVVDFPGEYLMQAKQRYGVRLRERFVIYAPDRGEHLWREFSPGQIVTDSDTIKLLESRGAPVERISLNPEQH
jgi:hypothetical protein